MHDDLFFSPSVFAELIIPKHPLLFFLSFLLSSMRRTIIALFLTCLCLALTASYVIVYPRNQAVLTMETSSSTPSSSSSFQGHVISAKMNNATIK